MLKDLCSFVSVTFLLSMLFSEKNSLDSFCLDWTGWSTIDTNWSSDCSGFLLQSSLKPFFYSECKLEDFRTDVSLIH